MSSSAVEDITDLPRLKTKCVLFFWAPWHDLSKPGGQMDVVFRSLSALSSSSSNKVAFYRVEAESVPELSMKFNVTVVPTFVLLSEKYSVIDRIEGADSAQLTQAVSAMLKSSSSQENSLDDRLNSLINTQEVMLFMKGSPASPKCGFSRQTVEILQEEKIEFGTFDILSDEEVRQGLKKYSDWPTYPQLYVNGELIGGLDIIKEMIQTSSLRNELGLKQLPTLNERLSSLINQSNVMVFIKGTPEQPRCGFSRQIVALLQEIQAKFDFFDILSDEEVRQGLKKYSEWPTYPQLYVNGELIGGLDIVQEMKEAGELQDLFS